MMQPRLAAGLRVLVKVLIHPVCEAISLGSLVAEPSYAKDTFMHHSRLCAVLIDCKTADVDEAAHFWAAALGRPVDLDHPMSRDNYRMLATPADEPIVEIQRVEHESRVHIDIETDDIPAEVRRRERLGATTKLLELALDAVPGSTRIGFLANPAGASMALWVQQVETAARARGVTLLIQEARRPDDLAPAFDGLAK